jgi:malonyl-CoA O-methyltransferase
MNRTSPVRFMRRAFNRASTTYDSAAVLQRELLQRLLARLDVIRSEPQVILDLGAGTGHGARALKQRVPKAQVIAVDFAESMLRVSRKQRSWFRPFERVCGDANAIPLKNASVDWVVSNAMLHCCETPDAVFAELQRVLKPGGLFIFSTFGPDTLRELRAAWSEVDGEPTESPVQSFIDMHDLGDALMRAGFGDPVLDVESFTLTYPTFAALLHELKQTGATYPPVHRGLNQRQRHLKLAAAYEQFRIDGRLPVSIESVFGLAWQPLNPRRPTSASGETRIPLSAIRGSALRGKRS